MSICITIRPEDSPDGFERFLSKFMARYYPSVQVAWMLLDAAGAEHYEQQLQLA
jgi:hypothetical protein